MRLLLVAPVLLLVCMALPVALQLLLQPLMLPLPSANSVNVVSALWHAVATRYGT